MAVVDRSDFPPGDTLFIRLWKAAGSGTGTLSFAQWSRMPTAAWPRRSARPPASKATPTAPAPTRTPSPTLRYLGGSSRTGSPGASLARVRSGSRSSPTRWPRASPDYDWLLWRDNAPGFAARSTTTCRPWPATAAPPTQRRNRPRYQRHLILRAGRTGQPLLPHPQRERRRYLLPPAEQLSTSSTGFTLRLGGSAVTDCDISPPSPPRLQPHATTASTATPCPRASACTSARTCAPRATPSPYSTSSAAPSSPPKPSNPTPTSTAPPSAAGFFVIIGNGGSGGRLSGGGGMRDEIELRGTRPRPREGGTRDEDDGTVELRERDETE